MASKGGRHFGRTVTVSLSDGSEFDFEVTEVAGTRSVHLYAERWINRRLPLNAETTRHIAHAVAEQKLSRAGLI